MIFFFVSENGKLFLERMELEYKKEVFLLVLANILMILILNRGQ